MKKHHLMIAIACLLSGCSAMQMKDSNKPAGADTPKMLKPEVKKIWIPPEIKNGGQEWSDGYYIYRIERGATWSR